MLHMIVIKGTLAPLLQLWLTPGDYADLIPKCSILEHEFLKL